MLDAPDVPIGVRGRNLEVDVVVLVDREAKALSTLRATAEIMFEEAVRNARNT